MTWLENSDTANFLSPSTSAFPQMDGFPGLDTPDTSRDAYVLCDEPACDEFWGVHGVGDFDAYLRTQGWSVVPTPDGTIEHKCLAHA